MFKTTLKTSDYDGTVFLFVGYGMTMREADNEIVRQVMRMTDTCEGYREYDAMDLLDGEQETTELFDGAWVNMGGHK